MTFIEREHITKAITRLTFNRPEKLNAFNLEMYEQLGRFIKEAEQDDDVKVIVLRGAGRSFCSGQDLGEVGFMYGFGTSGGERRPSMRRRLAIDREWSRHYAEFFECSKLTVSQIHGHCLGTGFVLMMSSDFVVAADDANIGHPGLRLVGPGLDFNLALWLWALGMRRAKELMFTGRTLTGTEAAEWGLINKSVPLADLNAEALKLAELLCLTPADGIVMAKEALHMTFDLMGMRTAFTFGAMSHTMNTNARFEADEFNFFRERREKGAKAAFHERDARYERTQAEEQQPVS